MPTITVFWECAFSILPKIVYCEIVLATLGDALPHYISHIRFMRNSHIQNMPK
jgi:hypothetical protein